MEQNLMKLSPSISALRLSTYYYGAPRKRNEGLRIGTTRYLPRGVRKADYASLNYFDVWLPILGPSKELLKWRQAHLDQHRMWTSRYRKEMRRPEPAQTIRLLAELARRTPITIGCFCKDPTYCHRTLLHELISDAGVSLP